MYKLPEIKTYLKHYTPGGPNTVNRRLLAGIKNLFQKIEGSGESFEPQEFLKVFMTSFPQFAEMEKDERAFRQQDADECFQTLLSSIEPLMQAEESQVKQKNLVRDLFELDLKITMKNIELEKDKENEAKEQKDAQKEQQNMIIEEGEERIVDENKLKEETSVTFESTKKLSCIIDNQFNPVNSLSEGIKVGLEESVEKHSEVLGRNALFQRTAELANLPPYLVIQKIRFVWREKDQGTNTEARKAKILRNVAFPRILDVNEFCSTELKAEILPNRAKDLQYSELKKKEAQDAYETYKKENNKEGEDNYKIYRKFKEEQKIKDDNEHDVRLWSEIVPGKETGNYELVGVITHKGRSTDSGHYVAWVQYKGESWLRYDDDEVTKVPIEEVLNLRGGGDWHMAYYLIYRRLDLAPQMQ